MEDKQERAKQFLDRMDAGEFDGVLHAAIQSLDPEELKELVKLLQDRDRLDSQQPAD